MAMEQAPNFGPFESEAVMQNPQTNEEVAGGSMSNILYTNRGYYVVCEFLIGTSGMVTKEGILYDSGINYLALLDETKGSYTTCDLYSLKFVTFYPSRTPYLPQPGNALPIPRRNGVGSTPTPPQPMMPDQQPIWSNSPMSTAPRNNNMR